MAHDDQVRLARTDPGPFTYEVRTVPNPPVATDFQIRVPGSQVWRLLAIQALLTTDATVPVRNPQLQVDDQTNVAYRYPSGASQAATLAVRYSWIAEYPNFVAAAEAGLVAVPIVEHVLLPQWNIGPKTVNIAAGDQWSGITVTLFRLDTPPRTFSQSHGITHDELVTASEVVGSEVM